MIHGVAVIVLCRALEEMQRACQAADSASREAEASSSASAAALQEQLLRVRQLQAQLDTVGMQHSMAVQAAQQSMKEQV
jgi:antirestriction protein